MDRYVSLAEGKYLKQTKLLINFLMTVLFKKVLFQFFDYFTVKKLKS